MKNTDWKFEWTDEGALLISAVALLVSVIAVGITALLARKANRINQYPQRKAVYDDGMKFLQTWLRNGVPEKKLMPLLAKALDNSRYTCSAKVTKHLELIQKDAAKAHYLEGRINHGDEEVRDEALEENRIIFDRHSDFDKLYEVFKKDLTIK
ncbi:MAG: hypothetical protein ABJM26_04845 [Anderseniella sp.]